MDDHPSDPTWPAWECECIDVDVTRPELAVAVALTHDIAADVQAFIARTVPAVGRLLVFRPVGGAGQASVMSGRHAFELAQALAAQVKQQRPAAVNSTVHLFVA